MYACLYKTATKIFYYYYKLILFFIFWHPYKHKHALQDAVQTQLSTIQYNK